MVPRASFGTASRAVESLMTLLTCMVTEPSVCCQRHQGHVCCNMRVAIQDIANNSKRVWSELSILFDLHGSAPRTVAPCMAATRITFKRMHLFANSVMMLKTANPCHLHGTDLAISTILECGRLRSTTTARA